MIQLRASAIIAALSFIFSGLLMAKEKDPTPTALAKDPMGEKMLEWSRQLGVSCTYCHNLDNFKDTSQLNYKKAALHQKGVLILQQEVFADRDSSQNLKVKVDCFMCHRGKDRPDFAEPPNPFTK